MTINGDKLDDSFYLLGHQYWNRIEPTIDGMLGGFTQITSVDIKASKRLLSKYFTESDKKNEFLDIKSQLKQTKQLTRALDCGSGLRHQSINCLTLY